jgi:hypothetical protein
LAPPPWGTNAIESIFTPIVAQSSLDASLTITGMLTVCGEEGGVIVLPLEPPPPPHADMMAAVRLSAVIRYAFETMIDISSNLTRSVLVSNASSALLMHHQRRIAQRVDIELAVGI